MTQHQTDEELRAELTEARLKISRQIEVLQSPSGYGGRPDDREVLGELRQELAEIDDGLTRIGADLAEPDAPDPSTEDDPPAPLTAGASNVIDQPSRGWARLVIVAALVAGTAALLFALNWPNIAPALSH
jgi:hypothetical protein